MIEHSICVHIIMTFDCFISLDKTEQELLMWMEGVPIAGKIINGHRYLLIQLYSFYVEVLYEDKSDVVKSLHPFEDMKYVDPYLPEVKVFFPE
jgi:hypothetical protein